jgi:hypothetical protein
MTNNDGSNNSSAASSPPSPAMAILVDGASDSKHSRIPSPFLSRPTSPVTGSGVEDLVASQFDYGYNMHGGMFYEQSHTPQACV